MRYFRQKLDEWRRAREALAEARAFHAASRQRVAALAAAGRSADALRESAAQLGIDSSRELRARIVSFKGIAV